MDSILQANLDQLWSADPQLQNQAFNFILAATEQPVDWAYEVWNALLAGLTAQDNHLRAITAQILCNLAKSDPEARMLKDFPALLAVTKDERFVTARHGLQALWKVGAAGQPQLTLVVTGLIGRFHECAAEKNCTLIRYDILHGFRKLYDCLQDENLRAQALVLIESEPDPKYRKKYASLWRKTAKSTL